MADLLALMTLTMQALTLTLPTGPYNAAMQTGRPAKHSRPPFGERLHALREQGTQWDLWEVEVMKSDLIAAFLEA